MIIIWFILCLCNVGSPFPLNLTREIILSISLTFWFKYLFIILIIYCLLSFIYSVYSFRCIIHGKSFINLKILNCKLINFSRLLTHLFPVNLLFFNLIICSNSLIKILNCDFKDILLREVTYTDWFLNHFYNNIIW